MTQIIEVRTLNQTNETPTIAKDAIDIISALQDNGIEPYVLAIAPDQISFYVKSDLEIDALNTLDKFGL